MTDPPQPKPGQTMRADARGECGACSDADGRAPSEEGRGTGEDRREEGHAAAGRGRNRAHGRESPVAAAAHRPRRRPSPTLGPTDRSPPQAHVRSQAHHRNPHTSIVRAPASPPNAAPTSSLPSVPNVPHARMSSHNLLPLLQCPLCPPPSLLHVPLTLHCGHSFCASHFPPHNKPSTSKEVDIPPALPHCPLPTCCPSSPRYPATFSRTPPIDVTTNKLLELVLRASRDDLQPDSPPPHFSDDYEDRTDSEREYDSDSDLEYLPLSPQPPSFPGTPSTTRGTNQPRTGSSRSRSPPEASPRLHPRKRRRRLCRRAAGPSRSQAQPHRNDHDRHTQLEKELLSELTCEICFGLFWQPITTPCQHTFCTRCLFRSLDHNQTCPLCRQKLPGYDYFQQHPCNKVILAIILRAFPEAYAERGQAVEAEERDARLDTPVFVCQLGFPGMPTILHFFEPRYRLMLRRCLENPNPCFGMIPPPRAAPSTSANGSVSTGNDYGIMLQIRNVQMLPDGRSVVETWGTWRFRIMERGMRDGYTVARVERIEDYEDELDHSAFAPPDEELRNSGGDSEPIAAEGGSVATSGSRVLEDPQSADSRMVERAGDQAEEALSRVEIGDVFVDMQTESESSVASSTPEVALDVGAGAIAPSSSHPPRIAADNRAAARPEESPSTTPSGERQPNGKAPAVQRPPTNAELMAKCHAFIEQTRRGTPWVVQHLHNNYVPMPSDPASFSFWMALLLPIDEHEKAKLLPIRSPRLRLRLVVHWIEHLNSQWTRAYASASALQVVLWRVRYFMMLPRAVRVWAMLFAYAALLAAIYLGQSVAQRPGSSAGGASHGPSEPGGLL
ncbi:hypothetical protein BD311DRAFT_713585 [Dichomitus squalens]|uniref:RING-type domain-containing protein n=1 Tax=Dichomitus squalens TaxID=114155 RepID=A0A4Q9MXD3_9APHY|nr:hypothetical protein BD311DRAFT_713585 [Dichomitus squalens]